MKLFLKGGKCYGPKCPFVKRSYPPGGSQRRQMKLSEFAIQLREKQKAKRTYGLRERQFKKYFLKSYQSKEDTAKKLMEILESRIDNVVYRAGAAASRISARQMVVHGKIKINGKKINKPSLLVKVKDKISFTLPKNFKPIDGQSPAWLNVDRKTNLIEIVSQPFVSPHEIGLNSQLIIEYYSR